MASLLGFANSLWVFLNHEWFLGVIAGFLLGEGHSWLRHVLAVKRIKSAILDELRANQYQIAQKRDVLRQMIEALERKEYLPGLTVPSLTAIFDNHYPSVASSYKPRQRDNLHVIYSNLKISDEFMNGFEQKFKEEKSSKVLLNIWEANISQLKNIDKNYRVTLDLIEKFLNGQPVDVFYRHSGKKPPTVFSRKE